LEYQNSQDSLRKCGEKKNGKNFTSEAKKIPRKIINHDKANFGEIRLLVSSTEFNENFSKNNLRTFTPIGNGILCSAHTINSFPDFIHVNKKKF